MFFSYCITWLLSFSFMNTDFKIAIMEYLHMQTHTCICIFIHTCAQLFLNANYMLIHLYLHICSLLHSSSLFFWQSTVYFITIPATLSTSIPVCILKQIDTKRILHKSVSRRNKNMSGPFEKWVFCVHLFQRWLNTTLQIECSALVSDMRAMLWSRWNYFTCYAQKD